MRNLILIFFIFMFSCKKHEVTIVSTTQNDIWSKQSLVTIEKYNGRDSVAFTIDTNQKEQVVDGFGGCLNELGWDALNTLDSITKEEVLKFFFEPGNTFNFNICRLPIGANDYARDWYSLDETDGDFNMEHFNIDRDKQVLIPYIKAVQNYNPKMKFWGSPWSPPSWMKDNHHYACAAPWKGLDPKFDNGLKKTAGGDGKNVFIQKPEYFEAYSRYFAKYVKAYEQEGISISAIQVQNEFNSCQIFPSCTWTAQGLAALIGKYLGPEFEKQNLSTEIWLGTIERGNAKLIDTIVTDSLSSKYVRGLGFQWAGKDAIAPAHEKYSHLRFMQTESECGDGSNNWAAAEHLWDLLRHYFNHGANSYMYWNLILEKQGLSTWGWKQNALISVDTARHKIFMNPEYYIFKHVCHFVHPGARKLKSTSSNALSFMNPSGELVMIVSNPSEKEEALAFLMNKFIIKAQMKAKSFNTIVIK